ncbi:MAG TPA: YdiU family protein [Polyangia bacterium]|nr:YdiU family protein [Polyangia bacterium]
MMIAFDNTYARLPEHFYSRTKPTPVASPRLVKLNRALAELLGLDVALLSSEMGARILAGNAIPEGADPMALAYAGHQFGSFVPQLGDGRAILLGEVVGRDGRRRDIQLKGSGPTRFSRRGDGRAALGPVLREYIVSEAMAAMGIPTTRALAAVTTGEPVYREDVVLGAVLTRVAASHIRVGTFEYFAAREDRDAIATLTRYAIERHYPGAVDAPNPALALLEHVVDAQAWLVAKWLGVGFVHGVMNTDNTAISGETIDYGPCAFLDEYHPQKKFSSIDHAGRYAFMSQPRIAQWNLARLAECLLPLLGDDNDEAIRIATDRVNAFPARFETAFAATLRAKLGLADGHDDDLPLAFDLLGRMATHEVDYTLFFRRLCDAAEGPSGDERCAAMFGDPGAFHEWAERWHARRPNASLMRAANPAFIPRNHRIEEAIRAATSRDDFGPFERLVEVLARPFEEQVGAEDLAEPPAPEQRVRQTFCGT